MFTVSTAAASRALLTTAEAKAALGITGSDQDTAIDALVLRISDMIAAECAVPSDGVAVPTLLSETIAETLRNDTAPEYLVLSRRPVSSITSVVEDGETLTVATDVEADRGAGILTRLDASDEPIRWAAGKIVVTYVAGYSTVPAGLKLAAESVLREQWSAATRDPLLKGETVEGIGRFEYWTGGLSPNNGSSISSQALAMLAPYRYFPV